MLSEGNGSFDPCLSGVKVIGESLLQSRIGKKDRNGEAMKSEVNQWIN
jgi:hypothetical protein